MKIWTTTEEADKLKARFVGINRAEFARMYGLNGGQNMVYQHITGRRPISMEAALVYARGFGCSLADISPRLARQAEEAGRLLPSSNSISDSPAAYLPSNNNKEKRVQSNVVSIGTRSSQSAGGEYIQLELFNVRMSAGHGAAQIDHPDVVNHLPVLRDWALDNLGSADPAVIKLVTAAGDSMHPTIEDGSLLFVDVRVRHFQGDGIYCLSWNGGMLVKRLIAKRDGSLVIKSDNPSGPAPEVVKGADLEALAICGRVKRWWSLRKA